MDAVKFLKEKNRMCESYQSCSAGCPLTEKCGNDFCDDYCKEDPSGAVAVVEKWSSEHPANPRRHNLCELCGAGKEEYD